MQQTKADLERQVKFLKRKLAAYKGVATKFKNKYYDLKYRDDNLDGRIDGAVNAASNKTMTFFADKPNTWGPPDVTLDELQLAYNNVVDSLNRIRKENDALKVVVYDHKWWHHLIFWRKKNEG